MYLDICEMTLRTNAEHLENNAQVCTALAFLMNNVPSFQTADQKFFFIIRQR